VGPSTFEEKLDGCAMIALSVVRLKEVYIKQNEFVYKLDVPLSLVGEQEHSFSILPMVSKG
jgi:hypothetical protein